MKSRYPHRNIVKINTSNAKSASGVKAVITAEDVHENRWDITNFDQPDLADDKVRFIGDPVPAVGA